MTRLLKTTALLAALSVTAGTASATAILSVADHAPAATCAPLTVLETRGEWSRVTLGETFGWVRNSDLAAARCDADPEVALDARYLPREGQTSAFA